VITHSHLPDRVGIRWLLPSLKVYYIPFPTIASSATLPNFFTFLPYLRTILLREHIHLIHAHASLSSLGHEGILHAHLMGVRTVFTDHSLFGFEDAASILTNKLMVGTLKNVDAVICVSHTGCVAELSPASLRTDVDNITGARTQCFVGSFSRDMTTIPRFYQSTEMCMSYPMPSSPINLNLLPPNRLKPVRVRIRDFCLFTKLHPLKSPLWSCLASHTVRVLTSLLQLPHEYVRRSPM
jgi:PIGA (GPI anchor biosynthesis).